MILGIDIGTTSVKAVLVDLNGQIVGEGSRSHDLAAPQPGWAEENPEDWWVGMIAAAREARRNHASARIIGIGVSGMIPAVVLLDDRGRVLRPSLQQNDARAVREIEYLRELLPDETLFRASGAWWNQQVVGPKLLWIRRHEPDTWRNIRHVVGSYEYVVQRLTGIRHCEANWALESGLWDEGKSQWMKEALTAIGIDEQWLPPVRSSGERIGTISRDVARETGLPQGVPVLAGTADHIASLLPAGAVDAGQAVVKLGGAGDLLVAADRFRPVDKLYIDRHCVPGKYVVNGCMATSGSILKWFQRETAGQASFAQLDREAQEVAAGSDGLILLPYFLGEKTPIHDPLARGTWTGLTLSHRRAHMYRSILEGICYAFRQHFELLDRAGIGIHEVCVVDGGARSDLWCEILAAVLARPILRPKSAHVGSAWGAALAAGAALGAWDWMWMKNVRETERVFRPDAAAAAVYDRAYRTFQQTYQQLRPVFPFLDAANDTGNRPIHPSSRM